jgi:hypothetical protein
MSFLIVFGRVLTAFSLTAHVRRADQRAGHRILVREECSKGRGKSVIDLRATHIVAGGSESAVGISGREKEIHRNSGGMRRKASTRSSLPERSSETGHSLDGTNEWNPTTGMSFCGSVNESPKL